MQGRGECSSADYRLFLEANWNLGETNELKVGTEYGYRRWEMEWSTFTRCSFMGVMTLPHLMQVPLMQSNSGRHSFAFASLTIWNDFSVSLHLSSHSILLQGGKTSAYWQPTGSLLAAYWQPTGSLLAAYWPHQVQNNWQNQCTNNVTTVITLSRNCLTKGNDWHDMMLMTFYTALKTHQFAPMFFYPHSIVPW